MRDPVIGADGHSYERANVERWLATSATSPVTRQPMHASALIPNHALRHAIEQGLDAIDNNANTKDEASPDEHDVDIETQLLSDGTVHVALSCHGPPLPLALILVLDVSGSMGSACVKAETMESQYSRLDLVKHSVMTMAAMMRPEDVLSIVTFSDAAHTVLPFTPMTAAGKTDAGLAVAQMRNAGSTNLWAGLRTALELAALARGQGNVCIAVLTDGEPTASMSPPRGILLSFDAEMKKLGVSCSLFTCGFGMGEALDTVLLRDLAARGRGSYNFIPDGSMVGTVFVHLMANVLSVCATNVSFEVAAGPGVAVQGASSSDAQGTRQRFHVGLCQNQQPRDFIIKLSGQCSATGPLITVTTKGAPPHVVTVSQSAVAPGFESAREAFVQGLQSMLESAERYDVAEARARLAELQVTLRTCKDDRIQLLLDDLEHPDANKGQIAKALAFLPQWGRHYLPCVVMAHRDQIAVNFKDAAMALYGGEQFAKRLVRQGEEIFLRITPPAPSIPGIGAHSMVRYMDASGGCLSGRSPVAMANGSTKRMDELVQGDAVLGGGRVAVLVMYTEFKGRLVRLGELEITPFHPVKHAAGAWVFPVNVPSSPGGEDAAFAWHGPVYNVVLDGGVSITVDGLECITLGHGITGDSVAEHAYFGSRAAVVDDLLRHDAAGFARGFVEFARPTFEHAPDTGLVHRISTVAVVVVA